MQITGKLRAHFGSKLQEKLAVLSAKGFDTGKERVDNGRGMSDIGRTLVRGG